MSFGVALRTTSFGRLPPLRLRPWRAGAGILPAPAGAALGAGLGMAALAGAGFGDFLRGVLAMGLSRFARSCWLPARLYYQRDSSRSEERRVGKECVGTGRSRG